MQGSMDPHLPLPSTLQYCSECRTISRCSGATVGTLVCVQLRLRWPMYGQLFAANTLCEVASSCGAARHGTGLASSA